MSLFSRSRNAVAKAGWFSLHVLGWPRPSNIPPERPTWTKEVPPERRKVLDRIFNVSPDPISKPRGFTPEELLCDPYPGAQASSMAQQSNEWGDDREVTDHYARRDAAERTLSRKGYTWRGGEEWKPPLGQAPEWLGETLEAKHRRVGAAVVLNTLGWRYMAGEWLEPPPKPEPEPIPCTSDQLDRIAGVLGLTVEDLKKRRDEGPTEAQIAERAAARVRAGAPTCPECGRPEGSPHKSWCTRRRA